MSALLRAEARKVLATRSTLVVAGFVVVYPALAILPAVFAAHDPAVNAATTLQLLRGGADVLTLAALLLGIGAVAGEYRHGTIVPTLLAAPRRERLVAAKLGSQAAVGAILALAVSTVGLVAGTWYLAHRNAPFDVLSGDVVLTVAAVLVVGMLYAALGVAVGALVKNQTAAVAGALIWVFVVENAIPLVLRDPGFERWLPGGASERLLHVADPVVGTGNPWTALIVLAGLAAVLAGAAIAATRVTDVQ